MILFSVFTLISQPYKCYEESKYTFSLFNLYIQAHSNIINTVRAETFREDFPFQSLTLKQFKNEKPKKNKNKKTKSKTSS